MQERHVGSCHSWYKSPPHFSPRSDSSFFLTHSSCLFSLNPTSLTYIQASCNEINVYSSHTTIRLPAGPAPKSQNMSLPYPSEFWICCCRPPKENVPSVRSFLGYGLKSGLADEFSAVGLMAWRRLSARRVDIRNARHVPSGRSKWDRHLDDSIYSAVGLVRTERRMVVVKLKLCVKQGGGSNSVVELAR